MTEHEDILKCISGLANIDPKVRKDAASQLYLFGSNLCVPLLERWMSDAEFSELTKPAAEHAVRELESKRSGLTVGIAVQPQTFESIRSANHFPHLADVPPDQDAKEFELHFERQVELDILTTCDPAGGGAIARYLQKFGEGIQQVEVNVRDVARATNILVAKFGLTPVYSAPRAGANGARVNFFLAAISEGGKVLIELVEEKRF